MWCATGAHGRYGKELVRAEAIGVLSMRGPGGLHQPVGLEFHFLRVCVLRLDLPYALTLCSTAAHASGADRAPLGRQPRVT